MEWKVKAMLKCVKKQGLMHILSTMSQNKKQGEIQARTEQTPSWNFVKKCTYSLLTYMKVPKKSIFRLVGHPLPKRIFRQSNTWIDTLDNCLVESFNILPSYLISNKGTGTSTRMRKLDNLWTKGQTTSGIAELRTFWHFIAELSANSSQTSTKYYWFTIIE